jgi:hypothetical protein
MGLAAHRKFYDGIIHVNPFIRASLAVMHVIGAILQVPPGSYDLPIDDPCLDKFTVNHVFDGLYPQKQPRADAKQAQEPDELLADADAATEFAFRGFALLLLSLELPF